MENKRLTEILTAEEISLAQHCLDFARKEGADGVRITLSKSLMNLIGLLNGEVDKTAHALDRSMQLQLFVDGIFGTFSSNSLEREGLEAFIKEAIGTVRMLEADSCRTLPAPERLVKNARDGKELELYDDTIELLSAQKRRELALSSMAKKRRT